MLLDLSTRVIMSITGAELKWFVLFNQDVEGARVYFKLFSEFRCPSECFHFAASFVCAARRVWRLLEAAPRGFLPQVAETLHLERRKKRSFFMSFIEARDAIEHIDKRLGEWRLFNLVNNRFIVADAAAVDIDQASIDKIISVRDAIAEAILKAYPTHMLDFFG